MNRIRIRLALSLITLALLAAPSLGAADEPQIRQSAGVSYVSGGIGDEERDRILSLGRDFNLKLMFATKSGAYLSDVNITLLDARGRRVLDAKTDGPFFYAKLPAGKYQIEASSNGTTLRKSVAVAAQGQRKVDLRWND